MRLEGERHVICGFTLGCHPAVARATAFGESFSLLSCDGRSTNAYHQTASPDNPPKPFELHLFGPQHCIMAVEAANPLISTQKSSGSGLQVALHPLVLLTISDYITRHTLRQQKGPIVGALLGQQNGREITIEHAYECLLVEGEDELVLHQTWFEDRLQRSKICHMY
jgi:hypothetical protein